MGNLVISGIGSNGTSDDIFCVRLLGYGGPASSVILRTAIFILWMV